MHDERANRQSQPDKFYDDIATFFQLSGALALDTGEEQAMLDLPAASLALLRTAPAAALRLGGPKLERRLSYAVPILQRMLAAVAS